jgi:hypothetical protein
MVKRNPLVLAVLFGLQLFFGGLFILMIISASAR